MGMNIWIGPNLMETWWAVPPCQYNSGEGEMPPIGQILGPMSPETKRRIKTVFPYIQKNQARDLLAPILTKSYRPRPPHQS